jgi:site-specific DNA recombinase
MTTKPPTNAAIYCRISRDREGAGLGVARQETDCRDKADALGWTIAEVYVDNDVSAYSGKVRKDYQRMLADVRAGRIDGIVAWHTDRLHRQPANWKSSSTS